MAAVVPNTAQRSNERVGATFLWQRRLDRYPGTARRITCLAIVVLATIVLYYELYLPAAVSPEIMAQYHMSFPTYVYITAIGNAVGAFSSLVAGLADRWGRANLVVYGLLVTALLVLFGLPNAPDGLAFGMLFAAVALIEGIILVATPALVRDFSPQLGRASAMGFWTLGPVVGSLVLSEVTSHTVASLPAWQDQFTICGSTGLVVFVIALFWLRELSPHLRDQLMVSMRDRALIEARAKGIDIGSGLRHPWQQMLRYDIIGSAFAVSAFLIIYYTAVGFFTVYFTTIFGYSLSQANGLGNWFWAFNALMLIIVGLLSDAMKVRKPFMVVGAVGAIVMTAVFASRATHPQTSYATFVWMISVLAMFLGIAYAPWMASFTETVERRNPALTATGLAVWGWVLRMVVALSLVALPFVVSSMTPLVEHGAQVQALSSRYAAQLRTLAAIDPATQAGLAADPNDQAAASKAVEEIATAERISPAVAADRLRAAATLPAADLAVLRQQGPAVRSAAATTPSQWQAWWWVCIGGEAMFLPLILVMAGRWSPRRARQDAVEHEQQVQRELAALRRDIAAHHDG